MGFWRCVPQYSSLTQVGRDRTAGCADCAAPGRGAPSWRAAAGGPCCAPPPPAPGRGSCGPASACTPPPVAGERRGAGVRKSNSKNDINMQKIFLKMQKYAANAEHKTNADKCETNGENARHAENEKCNTCGKCKKKRKTGEIIWFRAFLGRDQKIFLTLFRKWWFHKYHSF